LRWNDRDPRIAADAVAADDHRDGGAAARSGIPRLEGDELVYCEPSARRGTITSVSATEIGIGIAAVSAIAAAASALASYRSVALTVRPLVTADDWRYEETEVADKFTLHVPLNNRGPGPALNVRCRARTDVGPASEWSKPVYALPPDGSDSRELVATGRLDDLFVETRCQDLRGAIFTVRRKSAANTDRRIRRKHFGNIAEKSR
jgi:hypothetical protein